MPSMIHRFEVDVADVDRGVYEQLSLRVARHPSESIDYLLTRIIAMALHISDGATLTSGLDDGDQPALVAIGPTGRTLLWVDIGAPSADRLHKANKAAESVVVYTYKDPAAIQAQVAARGVFGAEDIALWQVPNDLLDALAETVGRQNTWQLTRTEDTLYITVGGESYVGALTAHPLGDR